MPSGNAALLWCLEALFGLPTGCLSLILKKVFPSSQSTPLVLYCWSLASSFKRSWPSSALPSVRTPHFLLVPHPEGLLLVEKSFQVIGDPGFVVCSKQPWLAEFDVFSYAVSYTVNVLPTWITQHFTFCSLKAVLQSLQGPPDYPCECRLPLHKRDILRCQKNQVVIRSSKLVESVGVCVFYISILTIYCSIVSCGAVYKLVESW